jgi:DNA invertase Pin-like site-specific DNA recombinase
LEVNSSRCSTGGIFGCTLAIYVRVSTEEQDTFEAQEASARDWAARTDEQVWFDSEACQEKQSAGGDVDDRKLGRLIERCEEGEFAGLIVRDESRFARDTIAGGSRSVACTSPVRV